MTSFPVDIVAAFGLGAALALLVAFVLAFWLHERREFRRIDASEQRYADRHETMLKEVRDTKAIMLAYLTVGRDVQDTLKNHGTRLAKIETKVFQ